MTIMVTTYILLLITNTILCVMKQQSKPIVLMTYFILLVLMSLNNGGPDLLNYYNDYYSSGIGVHNISEYGHYILNRFFCNIGFDFFTYRIVVSFICMLLLHKTFSYFKVNENGVLSFYMIYVFFMDVIQIRNFIMEAIIIFSLRYLLVDKKFNTIKYIVCVLIASLFHRISPIYLMLLIVKFRMSIKIYVIGLIGSILLFIVFAFNRDILSNIMQFIATKLGATTSYSFTVTRLSFIPFAIIYYFEIFLMMIYFKKRDYKLKTVQKISKICIIMSFALPLILINLNFYRLFRNLGIIKYIACMMILDNRRKLNAKSFIVYNAILLLTVCLFVVDCVLVNDFNDIVMPIFKNNLVISDFSFTTMCKLLLLGLVSLCCCWRRRRISRGAYIRDKSPLVHYNMICKG